MNRRNIHKWWLPAILLLTSIWLAACQPSNRPANGSEAAVSRSHAPQRVDIRGSIISSRYSEGQVVLEVESFATSPDSRYERAFVLVLPTIELIGPDGQAIGLSELRQGQRVAILLRGGGRGNREGLGEARKLWIESGY